MKPFKWESKIAYLEFLTKFVPKIEIRPRYLVLGNIIIEIIIICKMGNNVCGLVVLYSYTHYIQCSFGSISIYTTKHMP